MADEQLHPRTPEVNLTSFSRVDRESDHELSVAGLRSSRMRSAPTQKQVNYLAALCGRRGKDFHEVMTHVHTKAEASLKIDELIRG